MFDSLQTQLNKLLGRREDDPHSVITADQLKVVLKSIEGKYNNLKNENKLFKSKIEEQKATIADLERQVSGAGPAATGEDTERLAQLESELDALRAQLAEQMEAAGRLQTENLQAQSNLSAQEALVNSLRQELSETKASPAGSDEQLPEALASIERLKIENGELAERLSAAEAQLQAQGRSGDADELADARAALEALQTENLRLQETLAEHEDAGELADARAALEALQTENLRLQEALAERGDAGEPVDADELAETRAALEALQTENLRLQEALAERGDSAAATGGAELEQLELLEQENAALLAKVQDLSGRLALAEVHPAEDEQLDALRAELAEARAEAENARTQLTLVQARLDEALDAASVAGLEAADAETASSTELADARAEIARLEGELALARAEASEAAAPEALDELRNDIEALRGELDAARARLAELEGERSELVGRLEANAEELDMLRGQWQAAQVQQRKLLAEKRALEEQVGAEGATSEENRALKARVDELQSTVVAELEQRYLDLQSRLDQAQAENMVLQSRLKAMVEDPQSLTARERAELDLQLKRLHDDAREAAVQIASLRESKVKSDLDLEEAASELVELRRQLDDMRRDRNFYRERWEAARDAQEEADRLKSQLRELEDAQSRFRTAGPAASPKPQAGASAEVSAQSLARRRQVLNRLLGDQK